MYPVEVVMLVPCSRIHTALQPVPEEFVCLICGSDRPVFDREDTGETCPGLHVDDALRCSRCGYTCKGKGYADNIKKRRAVSEEKDKRQRREGTVL